MGTPKEEAYEAPKSQLVQNNGGTTLSLFGVPSVEDYEISDICKKYATNSELKIFVNNNEIVPAFYLNELQSISDVGNFVKSVSKNRGEEDIAEEIIKKNMTNGVGQLRFQDGQYLTTVDFYIKRQEYSGKFYLFLNNQYQFDKDYITKADIICNVKTNTRPGMDNYPVDPGRENLREPYATSVNELFTQIRETLKDIFENKLFKEGLSTFLFNKNANPLVIRKDPNSKDANESLGESGFGSIFSNSGTKSKEEFVEQLEYLKNEQEQKGDKSKANILNNIIQEVRSDDNFTFEEKAKEIIEELETPALISVQKDFVSFDLSHNRTLTRHILKAWKDTLKLISEKITPRYLRISRSKSDKKFIPGLIFSDECLALYLPPQEKGSDLYGILINPISIASIVDPELFNKIIINKDKPQNTELSDSSVTMDETPINRLATFLFHEAIHELTHLLYPDSWSGYEEFHMHISKNEILCHFEFEKVREITKKYMPEIKKNVKKLITQMGKDTANKKNL
jgi:hypothetical protein